MVRLDRPGAFLSPGLIDVTDVEDRSDVENFGPMLQTIRVPDFEAALHEANNTAFGLSAGLLSDNKDLYERFFKIVRAGIINWNRQITGASGALPFGGIKDSGNHRPSGYYAVDYCSYPIASIEAETTVMPASLTPGIDL
jgi:succinylglutamic semialdehyde dehydrogenase